MNGSRRKIENATEAENVSHRLAQYVVIYCAVGKEMACMCSKIGVLELNRKFQLVF